MEEYYQLCMTRIKLKLIRCRLAKNALVTIFDRDYRWYWTIDYVMVNYIGIHHLFYHIQ